MLILTRKAGEAVLMNQGMMCVRVLSVGLNKTILGFEVPTEIDIWREELFETALLNQKLGQYQLRERK